VPRSAGTLGASLVLLVLWSQPSVAIEPPEAPTAAGVHFPSGEHLIDHYAGLVAELDARSTRDPAVVAAALTSGRPTLLAFLDRRCAPCLRMVPVVAKLEEELGHRVNVIVVDTDDKLPEFRRLFRRFNVWAGPAFYVMGSDGQPLERRLGPQPIDVLRERLLKLAGAGGPRIRAPEQRPPATSP
jgi:thiol-disulfide isomerase/thioredoxin